jgi:hypothetical protein
LIIDLSLDWNSQKKALGYNSNNTGSSFGRSYPEIVIHADRYDPNDLKLLEKN